MQTGCDHYSSGGGSDLPTVEGVDLDQCKAHCLATESCTGIYFIGQSCYPYTSVCTDDLCQGCSDGNTYVYESSSAEGKRSTNKEWRKETFCESFFEKEEWIWIYKNFGYTGDYEFIYFE